MHRVGVLLAVGGVVLGATAVAAQSPQPTGMMSPARPFYLTNDGMPDGVGDLPGAIHYGNQTTGNVTPMFADFGSNPCNGASQFFVDASASQTGGVLDQFGRSGPEVVVDEFDDSDPSQPRPVSATYDQGGAGGPVGGGLTFADSDGDHRYERAQVAGTDGGGPVNATLDLVPADTDGDGDPDYVTFSSLEPLDFFGMNCDVGGTPTDFTQIWLPLARDLDGDFAVIGDLDGDGTADPELAWGPKLAIGTPSVLAVPTLSGAGVAVLALALLGLGVRMMRRRDPAASA